MLRGNRKLWIDTDIALGSDAGDVDDGFALAAAAAAHRLYFLGDTRSGPRMPTQLLGVSAVSGNTDAKTAQRCAEDLLLVAGLEDIPVVEAGRAASSIASVPDDTLVLAIGPLTNVAEALRIDPTLLRRIDLRIVATVRSRWRFPLLRWFCLNTAADRPAAETVLGAGFQRLRVVPLDVARSLHVGRRELNDVGALGTLGAYLMDHSERWLGEAPWRYRSRRFPLWDLVAVLDALELLTEPRYDERQLVRFDPGTTWERFVELLRASDPLAPR